MAAITLLMSSAFIAAHLYVGKIPTLIGGSGALALYLLQKGLRAKA
jgi:hypothetical protein